MLDLNIGDYAGVGAHQQALCPIDCWLCTGQENGAIARPPLVQAGPQSPLYLNSHAQLNCACENVQVQRLSANFGPIVPMMILFMVGRDERNYRRKMTTTTEYKKTQ